MTLVVISVNCLVLVHGTIFKLHCYLLAFHCRLLCFDVFWFHLWQIELLRTEYGARSRNTNPTYEWLSGYLEFLHCPQTNEGACPTESCLAMDSNSACIFLTEMSIGHIEKLIHYVVRRSGSINKE